MHPHSQHVHTAADRAKSIRTRATINESPTDKLIRELREENARLLELIEKGKFPTDPGAEGDHQNQEGDVAIRVSSHLLWELGAEIILTATLQMWRGCEEKWKTRYDGIGMIIIELQ